MVGTRSYEAVDDPADVSRDADGAWHIKAGARVRVQLTLVAVAPSTRAEEIYAPETFGRASTDTVVIDG